MLEKGDKFTIGKELTVIIPDVVAGRQPPVVFIV